MTARAHRELEEDIVRLTRDVLRTNAYVTGHLDGEADAPSFVPNIAGQQALRQLPTVRAALARATVIDDSRVAVIGHEVALREQDGTTPRYRLVIPGDGNASTACVSVDSPVGVAVLGRRVGDSVTIAAPAGAWVATIVSIT
ncbi:MAG: GreA/GreB family elongation factor [Chloroflexota bacterium]